MSAYLRLAMAMLLLGTLHSCAPNPESGNQDRASNQQRRVELIKFISHPALDATEKGVIDRLNEIAEEKGYALRVESHNAKGNPPLAKQLAESVTNRRTDLIVAIATQAAQAVARTEPKDVPAIPFVYGAVSDPEGAGLLQGGRATGIKNVGPNIIEHALEFLRRAFPKARTLGVIYNPAEQNSLYVQQILQESVERYGFEYTAVTVNGANQVASAAEALANKADIIYSANDNTVNSAAAAVAGVSIATRTPFVIGDLSTLEQGAIAAVGLEYYDMGRQVAELAGKILDGTPIQNVPPQGAPAPEIWINKRVMAAVGITINDEALTMVNRQIGETP